MIDLVIWNLWGRLDETEGYVMSVSRLCRIKERQD